MSEENNAICMEPGSVSWNELVAINAKTAAEFYEKLFGWKATPYVPKKGPTDGPPYSILKKDVNDERGIGGMMQAMQPNTPSSMWLPYVVVESVDASLKKAESLGAKVFLPATSIGEVGRIAVIQDPQGATIGLHEAPKD